MPRGQGGQPLALRLNDGLGLTQCPQAQRRFDLCIKGTSCCLFKADERRIWKFEPLEHSGYLVGVRMPYSQATKPKPWIWEPRGRMEVGCALNEKRRRTGEWRVSIGSHRHLPSEALALHWLHNSEFRARVEMDAVGVCHPCGQPCSGTRCDDIQAEPSWSRNRSSVGINGNDLQIDRGAQRQKEVVRPHVVVLPPLARGDAKRLLDMLRSSFE